MSLRRVLGPGPSASIALLLHRGQCGAMSSERVGVILSWDEGCTTVRIGDDKAPLEA